MDYWKGRVALVTGCSAGMGSAIVQELVKNGMKVVGCARRLDRLQTMAEELKGCSGQFIPIQCDLTKQDQILAMYDVIKKQHGGVDVLVNNAAVAPLCSGIKIGSYDDMRFTLDVNVMATAICTREAVMCMQERGVEDGMIIQINSQGGKKVISMDFMHFYSSTKYMVTSMTQALRMELKATKSKIRVTTIFPGACHTEMNDTLKQQVPEYAEKTNFQHLQPIDIANAVIDVMSKPKHIEVVEVFLVPTDQPLIY